MSSQGIAKVLFRLTHLLAGVMMCPNAGDHVHCSVCIASHPARPKLVKQPNYMFKCTNCGRLTRPWSFRPFLEGILADLENLLPGVDAFEDLHEETQSLLNKKKTTIPEIKDVLVKSTALLEGKIDNDKLVKMKKIIKDQLSTNAMVALQKIERLLADCLRR